MRSIPYERPVHYYETDRMACVHHSNYIRWFEEARICLMQTAGFPYTGIEQAGLVSPVLRVEADYKTMARFGETVRIETRMESYTGARCVFSYEVLDKETGVLRCAGRTYHCFLNAEGRPVSLKKALPKYDEKFRAWLEEIK